MTYKSGTDFLALFNPDKQTQYTADLERCYMGTAPALATVGKAFGSSVAESWLSIQLRDLSEFSGSKIKLSVAQADSAAKTIKAQYGYMTVTQLMHFFQLFKGGRYGKFYGAVDPITITEALNQYEKDRYEMICQFEKEAEQRRRRQQQEKAEAEAREFREALAVCNMPIAERIELAQSHNLTLQEIAEVGWLFRMGYEADTEAARRRREIDSIIAMFR